MKNMVMYKAGEHSWITYIKSRIKGNLNFIGLAEGQTGSGKSWAMMSVAYMIDPEFTVDQIAFSFREVMQILNADWFKAKKWKVILFDEAQTDINNRSWQSLTNKLMLYLTSTFRHQNVILLFATPYSDFIDSATMKLVHAKFMVKGHNRLKKVTLVRGKLQQYNPKMKKFYEHSLMVSSPKGVMKIINWEVPKPPQHLIDPYEVKKTAFTSNLNLEIERLLEEAYQKSKPKSLVDTPEELGELKPLTAKQQEIFNLHNETGDASAVATRLGIHKSYVYQQLRLIEKKGYHTKVGEFTSK